MLLNVRNPTMPQAIGKVSLSRPSTFNRWMRQCFLELFVARTLYITKRAERCGVVELVSSNQHRKMRILCPLLLCSLFTFSLVRYGNSSTKQKITVVGLAPLSGEWDVGQTTAAAMPIAVEDINNDPNLLPNHELQFVFGNTNCSVNTALPLVMNFWATKKRNVDAFIGGGCNRVCEYISLLAGKWNLPVISWGCMSGHLSNRKTFPTFVRTVGECKAKLCKT